MVSGEEEKRKKEKDKNIWGIEIFGQRRRRKVQRERRKVVARRKRADGMVQTSKAP